LSLRGLGARPTLAARADHDGVILRRGGMTICGGYEVDTPPNRAWSAAKLAGMAQQIEVGAVHEVAPAAA